MDTLRQSLAIVLVLALLWLALWFLRKKGWIAARPSKTAPGLLESLCKMALTPRHSIHIVRVGDRTIAIGLHPEGITFLGDTTGAERFNRERNGV